MYFHIKKIFPVSEFKEGGIYSEVLLNITKILLIKWMFFKKINIIVLQ